LNKIAILLFHAQQSTNQPTSHQNNHKNERKDGTVEEEEVMPVKVLKEKFLFSVFSVVCFEILEREMC